jgi:hypothetical protein
MFKLFEELKEADITATKVFVSSKAKELGYNSTEKTIMKAAAKIDQQTAIQEEVKFSYSDKRPIPVKLYSDKNPAGALEMPISHFCDKEG